MITSKIKTIANYDGIKCQSVARGELDQHIAVVVGGSTITAESTASAAFVRDDKALLGIRLRENGIHNTAAVRCAVAGIYIEMETAEAKRAMVARGIAERRNLASAVLANEAAVVFCESFLFHVIVLM